MQNDSPHRNIGHIGLKASKRSSQGPFLFAIRAVFCLLCVLCSYVVELQAQDFKTLKDGVEYAEVTKEISGKVVQMNLLRLDLKKVRLDVHHAMDAAIGTEKTSSIATRHGAFAAINAGFFRLDKSEFAGDSAGLLMIDGELLSEGVYWRTALVIDNAKRKPRTDFFSLNGWQEIALTNEDGMYLHLNGINRQLTTKDFVLYTKDFGATTKTESNGTEIVLSKCQRSKAKSNFFTHCANAMIYEKTGNSAIPRDGYVISLSHEEFSEKAVILEILDKYIKGKNRKSKLILRPSIILQGAGFEVSQTTDIISGVPQLIKDSKIDITWEQEKSSESFVETRHPRTAVAKLKDGKFLMITVDGRSESSGGIGLQDLAEYLLSLGATDAMNLDGGGSTTMFVDGKVVNKPSDKEGERKVGDAILVTLRKGDRKKR